MQSARFKNKQPLICSILLLIFMLADICEAQQNPQQIFQAGLYAEEVQGDLENAISLFQQIVKKYPDQRSLAANAWLHIGFCYEKMGQQKAREAYQKIIDQYPDQREAAAIARERLNKSEIRYLKSEIKVDPLVKYYFERLGIDITTAFSWDGNKLAFTDWTDGNLYIENLLTGEKIKLTNMDWAKVNEYAYHPRWSRDDQYIAYSYYRQPYFIELRMVSVANGKSRVVYSDPELMIFPQDWTPNHQQILCETYNFEREIENRLAFVGVDSMKLIDVMTLSRNSLGMKISPDGKYLTYDVVFGEARHIFLMSLADFQQVTVNEGLPGVGGFDGPIWSPDGKLILCRNSGNYDLWAIPVENGKQSQRALLVQHDLSQALLSIKGISHELDINIKEAKIATTQHLKLPDSAYGFDEEFSTPKLDSAWSIFEWTGQNVYDYPSFGHYSLSDRPGHLRYYLDPMMSFGHQQKYQPFFGGWYWVYPALEISRPFSGDKWQIEAKASFSMVDGANGRQFALMIVFDPERQRDHCLVINKIKDIDPKRRGIDVRLLYRGVIVDKIDLYCSPNDIPGTNDFTYYYRITREQRLIQVEIGEDGNNYQVVFSTRLRSELLNLKQELILTGDSWFVPAGSYADWDYIRFTILE